jgi:hypothetical protein
MMISAGEGMSFFEAPIPLNAPYLHCLFTRPEIVVILLIGDS